MKEKWQKPQLVCLYRGKPEESVLCGCKLSSGYAGPRSERGSCEKSHLSHCEACSAPVSS